MERILLRCTLFYSGTDKLFFLSNWSFLKPVDPTDSDFSFPTTIRIPTPRIHGVFLLLLESAKEYPVKRHWRWDWVGRTSSSSDTGLCSSVGQQGGQRKKLHAILAPHRKTGDLRSKFSSSAMFPYKCSIPWSSPDPGRNLRYAHSSDTESINETRFFSRTPIHPFDFESSCVKQFFRNVSRLNFICSSEFMKPEACVYSSRSFSSIANVPIMRLSSVIFASLSPWAI